MGNITAARAQDIVARYRKEGARARSLVKRGKSPAGSVMTLMDTAKLLKKNGHGDLATALTGEQQAMYRINELKAMSPEAVRKDANAHGIALAGTQAALTKYRRQVRMILSALKDTEKVDTDVTVYWPTGRTTITEGSRVQVLDEDGHKLEGEITRIGKSDVTLTQDDGESVVLPNPGTLMTVMVPITLSEKHQAALLEATVFGNLMGTETPERNRLVGLGLAEYQGLRLVLTEKGEFVAKEVKRTLFVRRARLQNAV